MVRTCMRGPTLLALRRACSSVHHRRRGQQRLPLGLHAYRRPDGVSECSRRHRNDLGCVRPDFQHAEGLLLVIHADRLVQRARDRQRCGRLYAALRGYARCFHCAAHRRFLSGRESERECVHRSTSRSAAHYRPDPPVLPPFSTRIAALEADARHAQVATCSEPGRTAL